MYISSLPKSPAEYSLYTLHFEKSFIVASDKNFSKNNLKNKSPLP
jgi:hypothetical protein